MYTSVNVACNIVGNHQTLYTGFSNVVLLDLAQALALAAVFPADTAVLAAVSQRASHSRYG